MKNLIIPALFSVLFYMVGICTLQAQEASTEPEVKATTSTPGSLPGIRINSDFTYIPPDQSPDIIIDRLSRIPSTIELTHNERVHSFINYFTIRNRDYTKMVMRKRNIYFPLFEKYLKKHGLPDELKYLSIIESGLNPRAISRARAVGLWQFMSGTGRYFGLHHNWFTDDRMDPQKSTEAACKYLSQLYNMFKDWQLALAAYNSGPGTVRKAIRRSGYKKNFWEVYRYLPRETRAYVPQFISMIYTLHYAEEHNLWEPYREELPPHDTINIRQSVHLGKLAELTGSCLSDIHTLNPAILGDVLPKPSKPYTLKLPTIAYDKLTKNRKVILDSAMQVANAKIKTMKDPYANRVLITYRVRSGDALSLIAERHKVRTSDIRRWNNLTSSRIYIGQKLRLWIKKGASLPNVYGKSVYVVQRGDTLWGIARKKGVSVEKLKSLNKLTSNNLKIGQRLKMGGS